MPKQVSNIQLNQLVSLKSSESFSMSTPAAHSERTNDTANLSFESRALIQNNIPTTPVVVEPPGTTDIIISDNEMMPSNSTAAETSGSKSGAAGTWGILVRALFGVFRFRREVLYATSQRCV